MKKWYLLSVFFAFSVAACAQFSVVDSIKSAFYGQAKPYVGFHNRNTFILSERTLLFGIVAGVDFNEQVKLYAGLYGFGKADKTQLLNRPDLPVDTANRFTSTTNFSLGLEYDFFHFKRLSLSVPFQIGVGKVRYDYTYGRDNTLLRSNLYTVVPVEFGTNAYVVLLPWAGLRTELGYRTNFGAREVRRLSSPYFSLGLSILLCPLYQDIKKVLAD